jgi:hypothetical protein
MLVDVVPRSLRTAHRNARREGVSSRRDVVDVDNARDEFIENIRQRQNESEHFDVNEPLGSHSVHTSPHTVSSSSSSSSASSAASAGAAAFAASSRVRRSPVGNESSVLNIIATLQQIRRSPSNPPVPRDVVALDGDEHKDDVSEDEQRDGFNSDEQVRRLPTHDASSRTYSSATVDPRRVDTVERARAAMHVSATPYDTSTSATPTPGGYRSDQASRQSAIEHELAAMRCHLIELQESHKNKDDIINSLVKSQQDERQRRVEMQRLMKTDARALINNVTRTSHPVVKTENSNEPTSSLPLATVHSPLSLAFPSLSPSGSPSFIVGAPMKKDKMKRDDDTPDEHKYDNKEDKKVKSRIGDLPDAVDDSDDSEEIDCSDDEVEIRHRDSRPDPTIKMKEPDSDNHLDSYPEWTLRREALYPFSRYQNLYGTRHSLLTALDRRNEWMRFGILTHFNAKLYGLTARRWFESYMNELGEPLVGAKTRKTRSVAKQTLMIPEMWYDPRDDFNEDADEETQDLEENSFTFEQLPAPLRDMPPSHERAELHHKELSQLVRSYVYQRKLKKIAIQPATPKEKVITQDMKDEEHPCARCKVPVYSVLKHMCTPCEDLVRQQKRAAIEAGYRPPLETEEQVHSKQSVRTTDTTTVKKESAFSLVMGTYTDPSANIGDTTTQVKKEPSVLSYREQEDELTLLHHKTKDAVRSTSSTDEDKEEERDSPLGDILSVVFQSYQRKLQRRLRRTDLGNFRERIAAANTVVTTIGKFDGSVSDAPLYLSQLCSQVQQYGFDEREIVGIMQRTLTGSAQTWLTSNLHQVFELDYKPIQALLHRFRAQYIGAHIVRDLRKQMASTAITNDALSAKDLETHYAAYQRLLMRLSMSDAHVDEAETRTEFFMSLPRSVRTFIGSNIDGCQTVQDVYVMAQKSVLLNASRAPVKQDGDLPKTIGINALPALPAGDKPSSKYAGRNPDKPAFTVDGNRKTAQCYHCGYRGHFTGECRYGKDAQTLKGQQAWAQRNQDNGWDYPYDQQWWINESKRIKDAIAARAANNNKRPNRQRPPKKKDDAITVSDDEAADVDEES